MKNFLIGTSALVGATLFAVAAHAEDPKVVVGGVLDFQAAHVSEDQDAGKRSYGFRNDSEVTISVSGKSDNGLGYGAVVSLESDVTADRNNQGFNASRTYTYLDGSFGHIELGSNTGAAQALAVEADNLARATGGIAGAWINFPNAPTGGAAYISTPGLVAEHGSTTVYGDQSTFNATKATYYSPRFSGFQVGLSLTPDLDDRGQTILRNDTTGSFGNVIEAGINYEGQWDNIGLAAAVTGQHGDADSAAREDLAAWNAGAIVSFSGVSLGGSYGDWNDSGQLNGSNADANYYTLGAAYDFGPFGASATWLDSNLGSNDFNNLVLGTDYSLAPGFTPYAELSFFEADAAGTVNDNDGTVLLLGTELAF